MKYNVIDINYTGCDPIIAEYLKNGKAIKCRCHEGSSFMSGERWVIGYHTYENCYLTDCGYFRFAVPIEKKERKAKTFVEIAKWLDDNNYVCNGKGEWEWISNDHKKMPIYPMYLFCYCGREIPDGVFFPEEWLE
jgi:hypothetical protein